MTNVIIIGSLWMVMAIAIIIGVFGLPKDPED